MNLGSRKPSPIFLMYSDPSEYSYKKKGADYAIWLHAHVWLIAKNCMHEIMKKLNLANYVASLLLRGSTLTLSKQSMESCVKVSL